MKRCFAIVLAVIAAGCATTTGKPSADAAERYGPHCESLGHARGSEPFRMCVETQDLNAAAAVQREYDQKLLRRSDCVDPRIACSTPSR
jgi:hypothetical protein